MLRCAMILFCGLMIFHQTIPSQISASVPLKETVRLILTRSQKESTVVIQQRIPIVWTLR